MCAAAYRYCHAAFCPSVLGGTSICLLTDTHLQRSARLRGVCEGLENRLFFRLTMPDAHLRERALLSWAGGEGDETCFGVVLAFTSTRACRPCRRHSFLPASFQAQHRACRSSGLSSAFSSALGQPVALLGGGGKGWKRSGERPSTGLRLETSMSSEKKVRA